MKLNFKSLSVVAVALLAQGAFAQIIASNQNNQIDNNQNNNQNIPRGNVLAIKMPQKGMGRKLVEDTTFTYYQQFLGPTLGGDGNQTYNVFQAAGSGPEQKSGKAPMQSFHAINLRHQITADWGAGVSLAASNGYTSTVRNPNGDVNTPDNQFFNARAYVNMPALKTRLGTLFSTISYEAPTSVISRQQDMRFGWVVSESFAFNIPSVRWTAGVMGQAYRMVYTNNTVSKPTRFTDPGPLQGQICTLCSPTVSEYQTLILSGGPYVNYRFNDNWMLGSLVTLDWDQKGNQTNSTKFNNNLPHRARMTASYFPSSLKNLASVGVFTQALLKFRPDTTAVGAEFMLRF